MNQIMILYLQRCLKTYVTEVSLIQTLIKRESPYKIRDRIRQRQSERKVALKSMQNTGKGSHKVFKTSAKEISQDLPPLGKSGS